MILVAAARVYFFDWSSKLRWVFMTLREDEKMLMKTLSLWDVKSLDESEQQN